MITDRKQLKHTAKDRLRQANPSPRMITLIYYIFTTILPALITVGYVGGAFFSLWGGSSSTSTVSIFLTALMAIFLLILSYGYMIYGLKLWRGQEAGTGTLFIGFSQFGSVFFLSFLIGFFSTVWYMVGVFVYSMVVASFYVIYESIALMVLLMFVMILLVAYHLLSYALAFFVLHDQPNLGALKALRTSKQLMKGRKMELIWLMLSFLGWALLLGVLNLLLSEFLPSLLFDALGYSTLTLLLCSLLPVIILAPLSLWLMPYISCAMAGYYDMLTGNGGTHQPPPLNNDSPYDQREVYHHEDYSRDQYNGPDLPI